MVNLQDFFLVSEDDNNGNRRGEREWREQREQREQCGEHIFHTNTCATFLVSLMRVLVHCMVCQSTGTITPPLALLA